jgi:site-specific recombinase XerD
MMEKLAWWLEHEADSRALRSNLSPATLRAFLAYTRTERPGGRYGSGQPNAKHAARPSTAQTYFGCIRAFVNIWLAEGLFTESPLANVKPPRVPKDQIQPLERAQVQALVDAARRSRAPERDVALVLLLVDTGMRVGELCGLTLADVDRGAGSLTVVGKGNKRRAVYMGMADRRALWRYLETDRRDATGDEPLFIAVGSGQTPDGGLTPNGVGQLLARLASAAGIQGVRCSPTACGIRSRSAHAGRADPERDAWTQFVWLWWERYGTQEVGVRELFDLAESIEALAEQIGAGLEQARRVRFGNLLRSRADRVYAYRRITLNRFAIEPAHS